MSDPSKAPLRPPHPSRRSLRLAAVTLLALAAPAPGAGSQTAGEPLTISRETSLIVSATNAPLRVRGSDGLIHLEYDLMLTNSLSLPVTLTSVEVMDAQGGRTLLRLTGEALAAMAWPDATGAPIPGRSLAAVMVDVVVPPYAVPARLTHRITYRLPDGVPGPALIAREVAGLELAVDPREPTVIAPPVRGAGWWNANGCCDASAHRGSRWVIDGVRYVKPELFAIDWMRLQNGRIFSGDGSRVEQYFGYGAEVVSVADGTVVSVRSDMPNTTPNTAPTTLKTLFDYAGNNVVVQIRPGVWATYAHLQPGSVAVRAGDRVRTGQRLGLLGSSGNSTGPHLHFQLSDGPDLTASNSLPFVLGGYTLAGAVDPASLSDATFTGADAPPLRVVGPARPGDGTLPLDLTVQDFR